MRGAPRIARLTRIGVVMAAGAIGACSAGPEGGSRRAVPFAQPVAVVAATTTTTTSTSTTTPHPPGLGSGDAGPDVLAMEQRLVALHYDVGTADGHFGPGDTYAVTAFQKVHGMARTGWAGPDVLAALATATDPSPLVPAGAPKRVEVDVTRQVLFLYEGSALVRILPVSTGSGQHYCEKGNCGDAQTPSGSYSVFRKKLGEDVSPLGVLYNPLYFNGGIAIHGEPYTPPYPASHGCVRIPMNASLWFYNEVGFGTAVYVIGGSGHATLPTAPVTKTTVPPPTTSAPPTSTTTTVSQAKTVVH